MPKTRAFSLLLLAAGAAVSACTSPPRSPAQAQADARTASRVYAALDADPIFFFGHVDVRVNDGVVHLSGYVWTSDAVYRAQQIARAVPGAIRVVDQLELERAASRGGGS
jgi:osmotically-inducible protein OsmY